MELTKALHKSQYNKRDGLWITDNNKNKFANEMSKYLFIYLLN